MSISKYVITGPSCCGKTSVIEELKRQGYYTGQEAARVILKRYPNEPDYIKQRKMVGLQQRIEHCAEERDEVIFLDRGLGDMKAYSKYLGVQVFEKEYRGIADYDAVFFLDPLPFQSDGLRREKDQAEADLLGEKVKEEYLRAGVPVIDVPLGSVDLRVDYILRNR